LEQQTEKMRQVPSSVSDDQTAIHVGNVGRLKRIQNDLASLRALAQASSFFSFRQLRSDVLIFNYIDTPGLIRSIKGVEICSTWESLVILPRAYPIKPPVVMLRPVSRQGLTFHPNVKPERPHLLCYGRHVPVLLLDELARRIQRIVTLTPGAFMANEVDALNSRACQYVRLLARDKKLPLREGMSLTVHPLKLLSRKSDDSTK